MKIFGIGIHRTGTSSLNQALQMLGYKSVHTLLDIYPTIDTKLIEKYDSLTDFPIPLLYKQLDILYPNAKFILTTRDINSWLKSVRWLFTSGKVIFKWDQYPIVNDIHSEFYGIPFFEENAFIKKWYDFHDEVDEYFINRPNLLKIDFTNNEGWEELCKFLDKKKPSGQFPFLNASK